MSLVHKGASYCARAGIKILIRAPNCEIDIPIVQGQRRVAYRVGEIDANGAAAALRDRRNPGNIKELAGKEIHAREKDERDLFALFFEERLDIFLVQGEFTRARSREDKALVGMKAMVRELRFNCIGVRRKGRLFHQNFAARLPRSIKRGHQEVQIHRQAVHADHFVRQGANQPGHRLAQALVIGIPRSGRIQVCVHRQPCPIVQLLLNDLPRRLRHEPERIADEVNQRLTVRTERNVKTIAELSERILAIKLQSKLFFSGIGQRYHAVAKFHPPTTKFAAWQGQGRRFCSLRPRNPPYLSRQFMQYEDNPVSIKYYVKRYILKHRQEFAGKVVIDTPAGSGTTSSAFRDAGAEVHAYDLFPEYFTAKGLTCERANIMEGLPVPDGFANVVFCQEGIEHFSDQYRALQEFNRLLKKNGSLFITTPNYSNLKSKLSYFLFETEYLLKTMPANEIDSIWMADKSRTDEIYFGHLFLLGIQKLRLLAKLSGFKIKQIIFTKASSTSVVLLPFAYLFILLTNWWTYRNRVRRDHSIPGSPSETLYRELMQLNANVPLLIDRHLFIEFEKEADLAAVNSNLRGRRRHAGYNIIT